MKNYKWTSLAVAAAYLVAGFLLLLYPNTSADILVTVFGLVLIIMGALNVITYFLMDVRETLYRNDFTMGIIRILLGLLIIWQKSLFQSVIPFLISIVIITSGFSKLQDGIDAKRIGAKTGWSQLILAAVSVVFGLIVLFHPQFTNEVLFRLMGVALIYSGASDLYSTLYLSGRIRRYMKGLAEEEASFKAAQAAPKADPTVEDAEFTPKEKEESHTEGV